MVGRGGIITGNIRGLRVGPSLEKCIGMQVENTTWACNKFNNKFVYLRAMEKKGLRNGIARYFCLR